MPISNSILAWLEYPSAAGKPESGIGETISASTFDSIASCLPKFFLYSWTALPFRILSGLEK